MIRSSLLLFFVVATTCFFVSTKAWTTNSIYPTLLSSSRSYTAWMNKQLSQQNSKTQRLHPLGVIDKRQKDMLKFINQPVENSVGDAQSITGPPEQDELADLVRCIVKAADGRKADNIVALRVSKISTLTSFVVIVTGNSRPQNQAIAAAISDDVKEEHDMLPGPEGIPEGTADSGWMVLDYGSVMVHVMTPKSRLYYNVEGQWSGKGGEYMDLSDVLLPNAPVSLDKESLDVPEEEDPFWS